ncbi:MAG: DMT family transporter [Alphaproteobacteria bacterium]|nr:DMT family transporter [Alphaproteobacteria bacterium]
MSTGPNRPVAPGAAPIHVFLILFSGAVYPLYFVLNNYAVGSGTPALAFAFWQLFGAALMLIAVAALRRELPRLQWPHLRAYLAIGAIGIAVPIALLTWLSTKLPIGILSIIVILSPPITYVLALTFGLEKVKRMSVAGIICGLGGILLLIIPELSMQESGTIWWLLLALLAPASFALANNLAALLRPPDAPAVSLSSGMVSAAAIMLLPAMFLFGHGYVFPGPSAWADIAILGASGLTCVMYVTFLTIVKAAGPVFFSQFNYVIVVAGLGWGMLLKNESYALHVWLAAALMMAGVALLTFSGRRKAGQTAGSA